MRYIIFDVPHSVYHIKLLRKWYFINKFAAKWGQHPDIYIMMKHLLSTILFSAFVIILSGCNKDFEVTSLELYPSSVETTPLDTIQISFAMEYIGGDFKDPNLISPVWE